MNSKPLARGSAPGTADPADFRKPTSLESPSQSAALEGSGALPATLFVLLLAMPCWTLAEDGGGEPPISEKTGECLLCHEVLHPGLVADWKASRHARTTPAAALAMPEGERRMSADDVAADLKDVVVGCYECHSLNARRRYQTFTNLSVIVTIQLWPKFWTC